MRVELFDPLQIDAKIRVTYNGKELFTREFAAGETPKLDFETPKESGRAVATLVVEDVETPIGSAVYSFKDVAGAKLILEDANTLYKANNFRSAYSKGREAIRLLEQVAPDSEEMAEAYLFQVWVCFSMKSRPANRAATRQESLDWYHKALAVWERNGNVDKLSGNLTNISAMYFRWDQIANAVIHAERGLKLQKRKNAKIDNESIAAWSHAAAYNFHAGNLDRAERIARDAIKRFPNDPNRAYVLATLGKVWVRRGELIRAEAEAIHKAAEAAEGAGCSLG
jgi:tetratricopeptide (TPR) repeat protein